MNPVKVTRAQSAEKQDKGRVHLPQHHSGAAEDAANPHAPHGRCHVAAAATAITAETTAITA